MANSVEAASRVHTVHRWAMALPALAMTATVLSGCVSTEQKATWLHVENARIVASQSSTIVRRAGTEVRVTGVTLLRRGGRLAIAVRMRSLAGHALNDLPISVGLRSGSRRTYLNRRAGISYFATHVVVLAAHQALTWVFAARQTGDADGRPFAVVGSEPADPVTVAHSIPAIRVVPLGRASQGRLRVKVTNLSSIPQSPVLVYGSASGAGAIQAAGTTQVSSLPDGHSADVTLTLVGDPRQSPVSLEALPSLF